MTHSQNPDPSPDPAGTMAFDDYECTDYPYAHREVIYRFRNARRALVTAADDGRVAILSGIGRPTLEDLFRTGPGSVEGGTQLGYQGALDAANRHEVPGAALRSRRQVAQSPGPVRHLLPPVS